MNCICFKRSTALPLLLCLLGSAPLAVQAQNDGTNGPPKVLVVHREFTKPGKEGSQHERTEGAFIQGLKANKSDLHYLAMTSLSGPQRTLFFEGYPTFGAWEEQEKSMEKNPALMAAMDRANIADGDMLASADDSVWVRRDDLSLNNAGLTGDRYMQISEYRIRPGHTTEWEDVVKLVKAAYQKGVPEAHWTMFALRYGAAGNAYLVVTPLKSGSDVDGMLGSSKAFTDAMGEDGMKRLERLEASCVESDQMNLFAFSPRMSNPPEAWVKAEPDFWKPKTMEHAKKEAAAKPAE